MAKLRRFSGTPVSEGVRLEVGKYTVFAVRNAQKDISVRMRREPRKALRVLMRIPLVRGVTRFFRDVIRFFDGIAEAHELDPQRPVRGTRVENAVARFFRVSPQGLVTLVSALCLPLIFFFCMYAAPAGTERLMLHTFAAPDSAVRWTTCAVRVFGFLLAVGLSAHLRSFNRLLVYRAAINQASNCYACTGDVTLDAAAEYPRLARRSEPAFIIFVTAVSIILFTLIPSNRLWVYLPARIGILLGVAAVLNEPILALENAAMSPAVRVLRAPMDLIEHIMTRRPGQEPLEVAVCAFQAALGDLEEAPDEEAEEV